MNLFILTLADGNPIADRTSSAVTSVTDDTVLEDIGDLVLGDSEPIVLRFTTGTAAPAFAGDDTYTPSVWLGAVAADGSLRYVAAGSWSADVGVGWTGRMELTPETLEGAVAVLGGGYRWVAPGGAGPRGGWLTLQVRITNPSGNTMTYAMLPVYVQWPVTA